VHRLITGDFVHNDLMHLLLNELMLYGICASLEEDLRHLYTNGSLRFLIIYLGSWIVGVTATTIRHRMDFDYSSAGSSGSILGCMMSYMMLEPAKIALYLPILGGVKNIYAALLVIVMLIAYQKKTGNQMMNYELHFFGALGGILTTLILFPSII
jgi:membrane associated rhomboid family serine protease